MKRNKLPSITELQKIIFTVLRTHMILGHGIPRISTLRRVLGSIEPVELENVYRRWEAPYLGTCLGKQIYVDGKTLCSASTAEEKLHMIYAWVR